MLALTSPEGLYALLALALALVARARFLWGPGGAVVLTALVALVVVRAPGDSPTELWRWAEPARLLALAVVMLAALWGLFLGEYRRLLAGRGSQPFVARTVRLADDRRAVMLAALAVIGVGALALLEPRPDAAPTLPWFLGAIDVWRRVLGPVAGLAVPGLGFLALATLPYLDSGQGDDPGTPSGRLREVLTILAFWLALFVIPTVIALVDSLAPGSQPFAEVFWRQWLDRPLPTGLFWRELPGMVALALWFAIPAAILPRWRASRGLVGSYRRRLGDRRYVLLLALVLTLALPVFALLARELLGIGPWIGWSSDRGVPG